MNGVRSLSVWVYLWMAVGMAASGAEGLTARVAVDRGVPRILINGKPERARIFYGQPQSGTITIDTEPREIQFTFNPLISVHEGATVHFRFGHSDGEIVLDDIRIEDVQTGTPICPRYSFEPGDPTFEHHWSVWPQDNANTVGTHRVAAGAGRNGSHALQIRLVKPQDGNWPDYHVYHHPTLTLEKGRTYRMSFWARSSSKRELNIAFYRPGSHYVFLGGPEGPFVPQVRLAAQAGVRMVSTMIPFPWPKPGEPEDWSSVDSVIETAIQANPDVLLIPRIPVYAPDWWMEAHPNELMQWRPVRQERVASPSSELFQQEASERLGRLIGYLEAKYGNRIVGYHPNGQNTGEWFYMYSWERPLNGYAPCDIDAFRRWLRRKYRDDYALRTAWRDPLITLDTAVTPSEEARRQAPGGVLRDPVTERAVLDFVEFQQQAMADSVCGFARVVRQATQGRKLVLVFYGYLFEFGPMSTGPASSGHYALKRILDCPHIDIVCSPISYFDRGRGQSGPCMTAGESISLAGKMWLVEDDTRTHITTDDLFPGAEHVLTTLEQTNQLLQRNVAQQSLRHFATWWMDLGATGWFNHPGYWDQMKRLVRLDQVMLTKGKAYRPEIALVIDEKSALLLTEAGEALGRNLISESRRALARCGAPYGQYLLDDVIQGRVQAKLYVILNAWRLSASERQQLLKATRGRSVMWCYAPGYLDEDTPSLDAMRELTGFAAQMVRVETAQAALDGRLPGDEMLGVNQSMTPLFGVEADGAEVVGRWPNGTVAVAHRPWNGGISWFVAPPALSSCLVRYAAKLSGVHLFTESDCNVYANGPFVALHASQDGRITVNTGANAAVFDVLTGERLGRGPRIVLPMRFSDTRILRIRPD